MIECSRCPGTICTVCSHSNMLMIECCTYGTRTVATLNHQHVTVRTYCTYGTRTVATLNHQHISNMLMIKCSRCPGTLCTVINVLTVIC
jgi:hypothetical protein